MQKQNMLQNVQDVQVTNNTHVKHAAYITAQQCAAQNAANAHLFTNEQHEIANNLTLAAQAYYFTKRVHKNIRKKFIAIKISNNTSVCVALYKLATKHNAKIVVTQNATILRLFAN